MSPLRGETKLHRLTKLKRPSKKLFLGNIYTKRDWGHAKDYVEAMWLMLQQKEPNDLVISTGKSYTIKNFVNLTAKKLGMKIKWMGKGLNEKCFTIIL